MTTGQQITKILGGFTRNLPHKYKPVFVFPPLLMIYLIRHRHWGCGKALRRQIINSSSFARSSLHFDAYVEFMYRYHSM